MSNGFFGPTMLSVATQDLANQHGLSFIDFVEGTDTKNKNSQVFEGTPQMEQFIGVSRREKGAIELFQLNELPVFFSANRPFVNADYTENGAAPYWLCQTPELLKKELPNFRNRGIGQLQPGSKIKAWGYPDNKFVEGKLEVTNIEPLGINDPGVMLYDLVYGNETTADYRYSVGATANGMGWIFTGATGTDLKRYPLGAIAVLEALLANADRLLAITHNWGAHFLQDALEKINAETLKIALADTELYYDINALNTLMAPEFLVEKNKRFVRQFMHDLPRTERDSALLQKQIKRYEQLLPQGTLGLEHHYINETLYQIFNYWAARNMERFDNAAHLGWRVNGVYDTLDHLVVTIDQLRFSGGTPCVDTTNLEIDIFLISDRDVHRRTERSSAIRQENDTPFVAHIDQNTYFKLDYLESDVGISAYQLGFSFTFSTVVNGKQVEKSCQAKASLPVPLSQDIEHGTCPLIDEAGAICGEITFDTRLISKADRQLEAQNKTTWNRAHATNFAVLAGRVFGQKIIEALS